MELRCASCCRPACGRGQWRRPTHWSRRPTSRATGAPPALLQALSAPAPGAALLLIDEVDRADEPFEVFLLEYPGEYQVSIPELGTISAAVPPVTIPTSNRTRAERRRQSAAACTTGWTTPERERGY